MNPSAGPAPANTSFTLLAAGLSVAAVAGDPLLDYLKSRDATRYTDLITKLGLRK